MSADEQEIVCHVFLPQGQWSKENLPNCTDEELNQYAAILKLETPDVLKRLFGQLPLNDVRNAPLPTPPTPLCCLQNCAISSTSIRFYYYALKLHRSTKISLSCIA
jgi:hypothetical protein